METVRTVREGKEMTTNITRETFDRIAAETIAELSKELGKRDKTDTDHMASLMLMLYGTALASEMGKKLFGKQVNR